MGTFEISKEMTFQAALLSKLHRNVFPPKYGRKHFRKKNVMGSKTQVNTKEK